MHMCHKDSHIGCSTDGLECSAATGSEAVTTLKMLYSAVTHQIALSMNQLSGTKFGIAGRVWDSRQSLG